jgi:hypothetical protein
VLYQHVVLLTFLITQYNCFILNRFTAIRKHTSKASAVNITQYKACEYLLTFLITQYKACESALRFGTSARYVFFFLAAPDERWNSSDTYEIHCCISITLHFAFCRWLSRMITLDYKEFSHFPSLIWYPYLWTKYWLFSFRGLTEETVTAN